MAFNRLADSQSKQLAAPSVEHGGDTALTVNIGVSDGGRQGIPGPRRAGVRHALGMGSFPGQRPCWAPPSSRDLAVSSLCPPQTAPPHTPSASRSPRLVYWPGPYASDRPCSQAENVSREETALRKLAQCLRGEEVRVGLFRRCHLPISQMGTLRDRPEKQLAHSGPHRKGRAWT